MDSNSHLITVARQLYLVCLEMHLIRPTASLREFFRIWDSLESKQSLRIEALGNAINTWNINELIRDALISRYHVIHSI